MDRVRSELLGPLVVEDLRREARRVALIDAAAPPATPGVALAAELGVLLVRVGCRLEMVGCRLEAAERRQPAAVTLAVSTDCGCRHG